jgi:hypothetical protein
MNSPAGITAQERAACGFMRARWAAVRTRLSPETEADLQPACDSLMSSLTP